MVEHALGDITGYRFRNADLLRQALTHRSFGVPHNERLEFLGDGVLNCVVAATLFEHFPQLPEGDLSRLRASLVNQQTLFEIAQHAGLGGQLRLGEGELKSGGAQRPSILADALEALIGAAFLDGGFAAAQAMVLHLFERFPQLPEGDLSRLRASLVNQQTLFEIAQHGGLGGQLLLGEGELKSGGAQRPSILADALEALIGAAFLDGGFAAAQAMVLHLFERQLREADPQTIGKDAKTLLQEFLQARRIALPQYTVVATAGEAHEQNFRVECAIPELNIRTHGEGSSRRSAEQVAARQAYDLGNKT